MARCVFVVYLEEYFFSLCTICKCSQTICMYICFCADYFFVCFPVGVVPASAQTGNGAALVSLSQYLPMLSAYSWCSRCPVWHFIWLQKL